MTRKLSRRSRGSVQAAAERKTLSNRLSFERPAFLDSTFTWWRRTKISTSRSCPPPADGTSRSIAAEDQVKDGEQHRGILRGIVSAREPEFRPLQDGS